MRITRREYCQSTAVAASASPCSALLASAVPSRALAQTVPMSDLMKPNACPTWSWATTRHGHGDRICLVDLLALQVRAHIPGTQKRHIDTGKVRFIPRIPLDSLAAAAFMLARTRQDDRTNISPWSTRCIASSEPGRSKSRWRRYSPSPSRPASHSRLSTPASRSWMASKACASASGQFKVESTRLSSSATPRCRGHPSRKWPGNRPAVKG